MSPVALNLSFQINVHITDFQMHVFISQHRVSNTSRLKNKVNTLQINKTQTSEKHPQLNSFAKLCLMLIPANENVGPCP